MASAGTRYCVRCDQPIVGEAVVVERLGSASGARPDDYRHPDGTPGCRRPRYGRTWPLVSGRTEQR
ncbi:hypothetical protein [Streptomyces sp. NPDC005805]|uniref:hypothetical protein n=1 Tax=Streptomyces sp. NPDC005805 TaxID=3157068 RepID=UPI0033F883BC